MKTPGRIELLDALAERDLADLDLDGMIAKVQPSISADSMGDLAYSLVRDAIRIIGPELFRNGYYAGAKAGMEIAREIYQEIKR